MEGIGVNKEMPVTTDRKNELFEKLIPVIHKRTGKDINRAEQGAVAFAVDELLIEEPMSANEFISDVFKVQEEDSEREALLKIYDTVHGAKMRRCDKEMETADREKMMKLKGYKQIMEINYNSTHDSYNKNPNYIPTIGGVRNNWVPVWAESSGIPLRHGT